MSSKDNTFQMNDNDTAVVQWNVWVTCGDTKEIKSNPLQFNSSSSAE